MAKLELIHVVEKNVPCQTNFRDKLPFVNSTKSLIFDLTKILLPKRLIANCFGILDLRKLILFIFFKPILNLSALKWCTERPFYTSKCTFQHLLTTSSESGRWHCRHRIDDHARLADKWRSNFCVVFTMSLCVLELKEVLISLLFDWRGEAS